MPKKSKRIINCYKNNLYFWILKSKIPHYFSILKIYRFINSSLQTYKLNYCKTYKFAQIVITLYSVIARRSRSNLKNLKPKLKIAANATHSCNDDRSEITTNSYKFSQNTLSAISCNDAYLPLVKFIKEIVSIH